MIFTLITLSSSSDLLNAERNEKKNIQLQFYGGRASVCMAKKGWIESVPSCNVVAVRSFTRSVNWKSIQFALFEHYIMLMRNNIQILPNIPG